MKLDCGIVHVTRKIEQVAVNGTGQFLITFTPEDNNPMDMLVLEKNEVVKIIKASLIFLK